MQNEKNESKAISLKVTEGLKVTVLPDSNHEFLMNTQEVANGYGLSPNTLRSHVSQNKAELIEGKHFFKAVQILNTLPVGAQPHQILWTKRGIVRLGFFIKTERAKLFRDWVEELVLNVTGHKVPALPEAKKRRCNRLSQERLVNILADVCRIEDNQLRMSITNKLMGGFEYGGKL